RPLCSLCLCGEKPLNLTFRTPVRSTRVHALLSITDRRTAPSARIGAAAVDGEFGSAGGAAAEEFVGAIDDASELRVIEIGDSMKRIDAGTEERFRFPDVADAGEDALIEKHIRDLLVGTRAN